MQFSTLLISCFVAISSTRGKIILRDVEQTAESNPLEDLQQLLEPNEGHVGHLSDVGPGTEFAYNSNDEDQEQQQQQQEAGHGVTYEVPESDENDLVKIELNRDQCTEGNVIRCFDSLNEGFRSADEEVICNSARSAVECVTELADICADDSERAEVQEYLDMMNNEVLFLCEQEPQNEPEAQSEKDALECLEREISYEMVMTMCGPEASAKIDKMKAEQELSSNDILCLSYKEAAACTTNIAEGKCGKTAANLVYAQLIEAINRFDAMKESAYCAANDEAEPQEQVAQEQEQGTPEPAGNLITDEQSQEQEEQPIHSQFSFWRKRRHVTKK